jgi:hypothetical protein
MTEAELSAFIFRSRFRKNFHFSSNKNPGILSSFCEESRRGKFVVSTQPLSHAKRREGRKNISGDSFYTHKEC